MTPNVHMTETSHMSPAELDRLAAHYVRTAKQLRSEAFNTMFKALFSRASNGVKTIFSRPGTLAGSTR